MKKNEFVECFGEVLKIAKPNFETVTLSDDECFVNIKCVGGAEYNVCVECDSFTAIMIDVLNAMQHK